MISFESEYTITDNLNITFGSTKIFGDDNLENSQDDYDFGYVFNTMENFSHNRIQLQYYF